MEVVLLAVAGVMFTAGWVAARSFANRKAPLTVTEPVPREHGEFDVLDRLPTGVVIASAVGSVDYRNEAAAGLMGTHTGVLVDAAIDRHVRGALSGDSPLEVLEFFGPPRRVFKVSSEPLSGGRAVVFIDDVSEQRRVDQMRTDFVANVSHELRTPIGALTVLAEMIADAEEPEVISRVAARMQAEADRASRTIDDLLELSELEVGRQRSNESVRLSDVVADAVGRAVALAEQNDVSVKALDAVGPSRLATEVIVHGDRRQLSSAVGNVVENAVKYSHPGGNVRVGLTAADGWAEIVVSDDGPGIPRGDLDRIFERFYRVDRARSRDSGGTGLGLSIVRHVMQNHDGEVTVESTEGEGATFVLRVPLALDASSNPEGSDCEGGVA